MNEPAPFTPWDEEEDLDPKVEEANWEIDFSSPVSVDSEGIKLLDTTSPEALADAYHTGRFGDKAFHAGEYDPNHKLTKLLPKSHRTLV